MLLGVKEQSNAILEEMTSREGGFQVAGLASRDGLAIMFSGRSVHHEDTLAAMAAASLAAAESAIDEVALSPMEGLVGLAGAHRLFIQGVDRDRILVAVGDQEIALAELQADVTESAKRIHDALAGG